MDTAREAHDFTENDTSEETLAANAQAAVQENIEKAHEKLDEVSTKAKAELRKVSEQSTDFVRENPGVAVAGALGVGILVGLALRQRY